MASETAAAGSGAATQTETSTLVEQVAGYMARLGPSGVEDFTAAIYGIAAARGYLLALDDLRELIEKRQAITGNDFHVAVLRVYLLSLAKGCDDREIARRLHHG